LVAEIGKKSLHYKEELPEAIYDNMSNCSWLWKSA